MFPIILALVCDPDPIWAYAHQQTLHDCHLLKQAAHQYDNCREADLQLIKQGLYCNPILGEAKEQP